ncbi:MAG: phage tail sheath C-terminal domain-containing protein [Chitinophagaceae bacterium]
MNDYKTPGVYVEEKQRLPPSIASVETAIPVFVGYTQIAQWRQPDDLRNKPKRIVSMLEYVRFFGGPDPEKESLSISIAGADINVKVDESKRSKFLMYYSLQLFFANGGGPCWIISVEDYATGGGLIENAKLKKGLAEAAKVNEITLLVFPDAINLEIATDYYDLYETAITQCVTLQDRFTIMDVYHLPANGDDWRLDIELLRNTLSTDSLRLRYAAAYFPLIYTGVDFEYANEAAIKIEGFAGATDLDGLKSVNNPFYARAKNALTGAQLLLPASSAMAGIYARVDNSQGVWKAPANVNILNAIAPQILITNADQESLNVDVQAGKSINAIRSFEGRGPAIVWGTRTLDGNSNEWRYISVRRFFIMVEESTKNATEQFVFEANDRNTWVRIKSMIGNYLSQLYRDGALMGASEQEAFFIHVGLNETMTEVDIWEGRLIIEIGMAVVRPAEFIILRFMHKMLNES